MLTLTMRAAGPKRHRQTAAPGRRYHHGDLRQALIDAALEIAAGEGLDAVTVRAAGKRAGVSSAAPFRHFPSKVALMTAVAEEAMRRFRDEITAALARADPADPIARLRALGSAYLAWALGNPTHFEVISTRRLIDFDGSPTLIRLNEEIREMMAAMLEQAASKGRLRLASPERAVLPARALVYGLARMWVDGHFAQWADGADPRALVERSVDDFIALLSGGEGSAEAPILRSSRRKPGPRQKLRAPEH